MGGLRGGSIAEALTTVHRRESVRRRGASYRRDIPATEGDGVTKRILVPLDGNPRSAEVLPLVADLARSVGSTIRLITVKPEPPPVRTGDGHVVAYADQERDRLEAEGGDYLNSVAASVPDVPVEHVVRFGETVDEIVAEVETWNADLVALTAPSRPFWRHLRPLDKAIHRQTTVPVFVYRPR
jgi:nucleotide-binding universal stress UspA family protein